MNKIIVGFSRPKSGFQPISWFIRLITKSSFSHAYIKFYSEPYERFLIYQASGSKVNFIGETLFNDIEFVYKEFEILISDNTKTKTVQFAIDMCGKPYGIGQLFGFAWVLFMRIFGKKVKNPFDNTSSFFCSELVSEILDIFVQPEDNLDASSMSPQDLYEFLLKNGCKSL